MRSTKKVVMCNKFLPKRLRRLDGRASSQSRSARKEPMLSAGTEFATFDEDEWIPVVPSWPVGGGNFMSAMMEGIFCFGGKAKIGKSLTDPFCSFDSLYL